ncbi:MAG: hypothetical protein DRG82_13635 [Deltaproteobacteria bacterium]|jgi:uncharacterized membrane protein|nr:MAG: hypothetical protein DRG82_13635 [Deltaproteobacteria bacterium]
MDDISLKKSEEYLFDTVKNVGIGLIVSALIGILFGANTVRTYRLILVLLLGIMGNMGGFLALKGKERKGASYERS